MMQVVKKWVIIIRFKDKSDYTTMYISDDHLGNVLKMLSHITFEASVEEIIIADHTSQERRKREIAMNDLNNAKR